MINEGATAILTLSFFDEEDEEVIPTSAEYKIIDVISGTVIKDWAEFHPNETTHNLAITPTENRILDQCNMYEDRLVTVKFEYGVSSEGTEEIEYRVKNLKGVV